MVAQFVLKIEKLSHIIGTTPILEIAFAYGLHPRLWLLIKPGKYIVQNAEPRVKAISKYFGLTHIVQHSYSVWRGPKALPLISKYF